MASDLPAPTATDGPAPTFLIIGAMKAGTTSLWRELRRHPDVFMPDLKEFQFFSDKRKWAQGMPWYRSHFAEGAGRTALGEASTGYTKYPKPEGVAERIARELPDVRLVYLVRDPIERIQSHYIHSYHKARERRPIDVAVREMPAFLAISRYRTQIDRYLAVLPAEQLLVVTTEDLRDRRPEVLRRVFGHIGVDPDTPLADAAVEEHRSADKRLDTKVSDTLRRLPGYRLASEKAGDQLKRRYRDVATKAVTDEVDTTLSPATRTWLENQLREEVAGLRPFLPDHFDGWGIDRSPAGRGR